jgi:NAD-dependent aldehyde dehydrogenases
MNAVAEIKAQLQVRHESLRIGGEKIFRDEVIEVRNPYDGTLVGTVPKATLEDVRRAFEFARAYRPALTRYERAAILRRAADAVRHAPKKSPPSSRRKPACARRIRSTKPAASRTCWCSAPAKY